MAWEWAVAENAWRVADGLWRILLPMPWAVPFVNAYVVESRGQFMLIDAGTGWTTSLRALGRALKAIGVPRDGLDRTILTHRHIDHAGGAKAIQARWGGRVFLHPADLAYSLPEADVTIAWSGRHGADPALAERMAAALRDEVHVTYPDAVEPLTAFAFGDLAFDVIHVPGHSQGHVLLHERTRDWLFVGDQVLGVTAPSVWANPGTGASDPFGDYLASLAATAALTAGLVLPGHGLPMTEGLREITLEMLRYQEGFREKVLGAVGPEPSTSWEVLLRLQPAVASSPRRAGSALAEVIAVLLHLARTGRVEQIEEGLWARRGGAA